MRKLCRSLSFRLLRTGKRKVPPVYERVTGAFRGYSIAAYACELRRGSGVYTAFYKVCDGRPPDYWGAHCLLKGATHGNFASPAAALVAADQLAHLAIGNLPTLERLRCFDAARMFRFVGLDQWPRQESA